MLSVLHKDDCAGAFVGSGLVDFAPARRLAFKSVAAGYSVGALASTVVVAALEVNLGRGCRRAEGPFPTVAVVLHKPRAKCNGGYAQHQGEEDEHAPPPAPVSHVPRVGAGAILRASPRQCRIGRSE